MNLGHKMPITLLSSLFLGLAVHTTRPKAEDFPDFTQLAETNARAVVHINTTFKADRPAAGEMPFRLPDIPEDSPFHEFFRRYFEEMPDDEQHFNERASLGSGFIMASDGYIITNNHVVENSDKIVVRLNDRREFDAEIVGIDARSDIAVLKINEDDLPVLRLGDSEKLKVGEWVLAIGSPFNLDYSVTKGIVSAIGRPLPNESYVPFIQTDVPINPGNSGGPLINMDGEVVGVNSQIYSRTGGYMGLSFAVPSNLVANVYRQIREYGHVSRGWLGVLIQDVTKELAESFSMEKSYGAAVAKVLAGSPANEAGIEVGDVIIRFAGAEVSSSLHLPAMVGNAKVGDTIPVEVVRRGHNKTLQVTIAELPDEEEITATETRPEPVQGASSDNRLNVSVRDLTDAERDELELPEGGVIVAGVEDGPASQAGVRDGDVILILDNLKVINSIHFIELVAGLPSGKSIPLLVQRRGTPTFLAIKVVE